MAKKKLPFISVELIPNGYSLKFEGMTQPNGYLYFSPDKLLDGFMMHIGLGMTGQLDTSTMQDFIVAVCKWSDNKKCVDEIERLKLEMKMLKGKRAALARRLIDERRRHRSLAEDINSLIHELKDYPDKSIRERLSKEMRGRTNLFELSLDKLNVSVSDFLDDDEEETDNQ